MSLREDNHEFFFEEPVTIEMQLIDGRAQESDINFAILESFILLRGKNIFALNFHGRPVFAMLKYNLADRCSQSRRHTDAHNAGLAFLRVARGLRCMAGLNDQLAGFLEKRLTGFGELHAALIAREQRDAQILFQLPDLTAEWRLRDVQLLCGSAEVAVLRNGKKVANVT